MDGASSFPAGGGRAGHRGARTVADVLRRAAAEAPDQQAVEVIGAADVAGVEEGGDIAGASLTFAQWNARASRVGQALLRAGVAKGDRVALLFDNAAALDYLACYFGVHKAGGVAVPVGPRLAPPELRAIFAHAQVRAAVAAPSLVARARNAVPADASVYAAPELVLAAGVSAADPEVPVAPDDLADILYTSGTTGSPKGVACTHASVTVMANRALKAFAGQPFLHAVPLYTFAGAHGMTFLPLRARMVATVMAEFDAARFLAVCAARRAAVAFIVPAMGRLLLDAPGAARRDTSAVKVLMFGSAPMPPSTIEALAAIFPQAHLVNLYSSTEAGAATCALPPGEAARRPGSVGLPIPPTEVRIVRDDDTSASVGETGEVWLKSVAPPRVYYRDPAATAAAWAGDWLRTGDVGYLDADGYLYLVDRKRDLVIRGGFNVFTGEIDAVLEAHFAVREAAVIGVPHDVLGEDLCAFVALRPGRVADAAALRAHCLARVADYKSPRQFVFVEALPRSALGKVLKRALRQRWDDERAP
ncbi:MAG TPA: class I adenylate-forming enzyme family protein [Myxococcota bacterium]|nr:class I adenylate-forming enzyme family protein [Myxococcota bacterium]